MLKVSITGQMGSGKTFITKLFEAIGVPCLSMDIVAKKVQVKYKDLNEKLIKRFPDGCTKDGNLIKEEMIRILFFDETNQNIKDIEKGDI